MQPPVAPGQRLPLALIPDLDDLSRFADGDRAASCLELTPSVKQAVKAVTMGTFSSPMPTLAAQSMARQAGPLCVFLSPTRQMQRLERRCP